MGYLERGDMKRSCLRALVMVPFILALALGGCSPRPPGETGANITVRVVATQDFGQELMFDETLEVAPGTSAMEALHRVAQVETAYGGGFVNAINGVRSEYGHGTTQDWFICVNGIMSNVGALDYTLHDGDIEHWDFHNWGFRMFIPALIGDFPEPFVHGYRGEVYPLVIVYTDGLQEYAEALESILADFGVGNVSIHHATELTENDKQHSNIILVETMDCSLVLELNQAWDRLGFFVHFEDGAMVVYDSEGDVEAEYGAGCGVVQATQSPWNPKGIGVCENIVWMVSGTDEAGVKSAVDALISHHDEYEYAYAIVVANGETVKVPQ